MSDCCRPPEDPDAPRARRLPWKLLGGLLFLAAVLLAVVILNA